MMQFLRVATVVASCCLLFKDAVGTHPGTGFTQQPPNRVFGNLGSDVIFSWTVSFGDQQDRTQFDELYWGKTDNNDRIRDKYQTVNKDGTVLINSNLQPRSLQFRLRVNKTINQKKCSVQFVLRNVTRLDALITYGCTAVIYGEDFRSGPINLVIQVPPKITKRSNAIIDVEEGEDVKLLCDSSGDPTPFMEWTNNGVLLQRRNTTAELTIPNIELKDGGSYICTAKNQAGMDSYSTLVRVVRYRPYVNITSSSQIELISWLNHTTSLKCAVNANPAANFTWFKDNRPIFAGLNTARDVSTLTLTPKTTDNFGHYSCKATNDKGTAWHNITVKQLLPPGPPVFSKLEPAMLSINIAWNRSRDDGGSPTLDYRIILLDANKNRIQVRSGINENNYTVRNVKHNRTYVILLQARNVVGYGNPANVTVSTLEADPPRILSITTVPSLMSVNISWNSTNDNTGINILDYRVVLTDTITQKQREFREIYSLNLYVKELRHNRTYIVQVQARNEDGYGRFRSKNFTTLEADPPGAPTIKVIPLVLALKVTWNSSLRDANNIKILDYTIKIFDRTILREEYIAVGRTSIVAKNLARNRTYVVVIQARNEVGFGETVNITATTLLAGPPDAPSITNTTVYGKRCVLQWTKPYNGESPIQFYIISVWVSLTNNRSHHKERPSTWNTTETTYSLDLNWNQNYTVTVSAWNRYGHSFYGLERHFKTETRPQEITTKGTEVLSTSPATTKDISSTEDTATSLTEYPTIKQEVRTGGSGANEEQKNSQNSFAYFAPLWIVVTAFAIPAVVFMLWKASQKIALGRCCRKQPRSGRPRQFHNRDSESSVTMDEVKETKVANHYETITEILEMNFNHGFTTDDEKGLRNGLDQKLSSLPGYNVYNNLYETPLDSALQVQQTPKEMKVGHVKPTTLGHKEIESGLGMFPNNVYSQLIHGDPYVKRPSPAPSGYSTITPKYRWEVSRDRLQLQGAIGRWEYGLVKRGLALNVTENGGWIPVAVKTLNDSGVANEVCRKDLLSELKVMKDLSPHKHVIQLLGCITESEPLCVITEFAPYGDLLGFLRKKRGLEDDYYSIDHLPRRSLTSQRLMQFAWEIADGMAYLSSAKIIHRDLAARNVLLGEDLKCKVTDFGMARDIRGQNIYQKNTGGRLPVKWTAIEALLHGQYTTKSDVWSFGVVLFEIVTMGGNPYPGMEVLELIDRLESGYRMGKPRRITNEMYALMLSCWNEDPAKRPTFPQLHSTLKQLAEKKQSCINLKAYDGKLYENFTPS